MVGGTSSPCRSTRSEDLGPRPHATYSCGVSSLARSEIYTTEREHDERDSQRGGGEEGGGGGMDRWMVMYSVCIDMYRNSCLRE